MSSTTSRSALLDGSARNAAWAFGADTSAGCFSSSFMSCWNAAKSSLVATGSLVQFAELLEVEQDIRQVISSNAAPLVPLEVQDVDIDVEFNAPQAADGTTVLAPRVILLPLHKVMLGEMARDGVAAKDRAMFQVPSGQRGEEGVRCIGWCETGRGFDDLSDDVIVGSRDRSLEHQPCRLGVGEVVGGSRRPVAPALTRPVRGQEDVHGLLVTCRHSVSLS